MTLLAFGEKTGVGLYRVSFIYTFLQNRRLIMKQRLYDRYRWTVVRDQFRETFLSLYALPSQSLLSLSVHAGLSALRLPCCSQSHSKTPHVSAPTPPLMTKRQSIHEILNDEFSSEDLIEVENPRVEPDVGHIDCPTCGKHLSTLAEQVPMSHHVNSTIVCRISGEVMDSQNEPLAFPNGNVYSSKVSNLHQGFSAYVSCPKFRMNKNIQLITDRPYERWPKRISMWLLAPRPKSPVLSPNYAKFTSRNRISIYRSVWRTSSTRNCIIHKYSHSAVVHTLSHDFLLVTHMATPARRPAQSC